MREEVIAQPVVEDAAATVRRISWQAIIGGLIVTLAVQLLLTVLAFSIGVTTVAHGNIQTEPGQNAGLTAAIVMIVICIISLFFGGWVSGRMSGLVRNSEGALHGLVTWGAATLLTVCLLGSAAKSVLGGMGKFWTQNLPSSEQMDQLGLTPAAQSGTSSSVANNNNVNANNDLNSIKQEARNIAQKHAAKPTGRPSEGQQPGEQPQGASSQLVAALDRMFSHGENINPSDRETVVNILVTQDNMSRADANETVDRWIKAYRQKAPAATGGGNGLATAESISQTALAAGWGSFVALVLGAIFAMWGGSLGASAFLRATRVEPVAAR